MATVRLQGRGRGYGVRGVILGFVFVLAMSTVEFLQARPLDARAGRILAILNDVSQRDGKRELTPEELSTVLAFKESDGVKQTVAYALLWSSSNEAAEALEVLGKDRNPHVQAMVDFVLLMKRASLLPPEERLAVLSIHLGREPSHIMRILIVAELGKEFKGVVVPLFLDVLDVEASPMVKAELYYQIAHLGNENQLQLFFARMEKDQDVHFLPSISETLNSTYYHKPLKRKRIPIKQFMEVIVQARSEVE